MSLVFTISIMKYVFIMYINTFYYVAIFLRFCEKIMKLGQSHFYDFIQMNKQKSWKSFSNMQIQRKKLIFFWKHWPFFQNISKNYTLQGISKNLKLKSQGFTLVIYKIKNCIKALSWRHSSKDTGSIPLLQSSGNPLC